jgi:F0F1-type ATP synthase membrane subunit c/vacuolar-type H+-ATPase subunit K
LLAPGTVSGNVPNRNFVYVMVSVGIGCLVAGITIGIFFARQSGF